MQFPKITLFFIFLFGFLLTFVSSTKAQSTVNEVFTNAQIAIKNGSATPLSRYFANGMELTILGKKGSYSKNQAQVVIGDFFKTNAPSDYYYQHKGSNKEQSLHYSIGEYNSNGKLFRVYMVVREVEGVYLIDTLDFSEK